MLPKLIFGSPRKNCMHFGRETVNISSMGVHSIQKNILSTWNRFMSSSDCAGSKVTSPKTWDVTLYKNKDERSDCNYYRGISLLSIVGKVFAPVTSTPPAEPCFASLSRVTVWLQSREVHSGYDLPPSAAGEMSISSSSHCSSPSWTSPKLLTWWTQAGSSRSSRRLAALQSSWWSSPPFTRTCRIRSVSMGPLPRHLPSQSAVE